MQYIKCKECAHGGNSCQIIMAHAMGTIHDLEYLINISQTRQTNHKCNLKIDYSCENFTPRTKEDTNDKE